MTPEIFTALALFALSSVITPGPNNLMLMASGANFGFVRSVPHMFGVGLGFPLMILPVGLGVMALFDAVPLARTLLTVLSVAYLLWLAWRIAHAAAPGEAAAGARPLRFVEACAFQWVNPKAWSMALSAITLFAPGREFGAVLWVAGTYAAMGCISTTTWVTLGRQIRRFLTTPRRLQLFNWSMAGLLVASMLLVFAL
ncbi:LysE family translocator [Cognatishimia sp. F0-27]|uniref:LysE family translocator n=1 Tax=Cognatishimia sp. F0-27 TaxID=2816855 RepID=UPI001D0C7232|nr:LysE family translocator [Cognatishimia sp. F0-27]MCC1492884.1 LysE family translocator [Cognatishimia sp. F0-27]